MERLLNGAEGDGLRGPSGFDCRTDTSRTLGMCGFHTGIMRRVSLFSRSEMAISGGRSCQSHKPVQVGGTSTCKLSAKACWIKWITGQTSSAGPCSPTMRRTKSTRLSSGGIVAPSTPKWFASHCRQVHQGKIAVQAVMMQAPKHTRSIVPRNPPMQKHCSPSSPSTARHGSP